MYGVKTVYESKYNLYANDIPKLTVSYGSGLSLSLQTNDFHIEYRDGKAEICLSHIMTLTDAKQMAEAILDQIKEVEEEFKRDL